ncbi:LysM peptidoglycan-binding domain-containing protein [Aquimarina sp. TRL1]|uniref:LysM peptidoglycan-binding domain-containing protein n=1 Tax=Aquimarina sp. (strain TRL1) TaxID=2736252 RepID=UPI00158C936B|nr:LysM peptidoglycan-binding domain-containing protein [Aquimarina sp. TRL1]QKX05695.1 LysM peptidoglycan-binding domain-containing protein [Aquimarina sp. TRL1]
MNKVLMFVLLLFVTSVGLAQQYKSHKVAKGENVYRIAKRYNVTPEVIYKVNPTAKDGIKEGEILAIPVANDKEYKTHLVEEGDTVYSISKKYGITPEEIYKLNPEARDGINIDQILKVGIVSTEKTEIDTGDKTTVSVPVTEETGRTPVSFRTHKVKKKETLTGIAKAYSVTIDEIKKHNKRLYSEGIRKKDKLRIPVYESVAAGTDEGGTPVGTVSQVTTYVVKPKDTKFGIARKHGITIEELEQLNPEMDPDFPIGMEIKVPTSVFVEYGDVLEEGFELYKIQPKETMFSLVRRLDISSDSLMKMNPYIKDGLKAGMVITIPKQNIKDSLSFDYAEGKTINLERKLFNFKQKKIGVMLPFSLESIDINTRSKTEEYLKRKQSLRVALDFYSGILIAVDSAKTRGISTELSVFDTEKDNNVKGIKEIMVEANFDEMDAVIGPLYQSNVELVTAELKKYDVPVFSPASKKESKLYGNFFQTRPSKELLEDKLISYVEKDSTDKNIIIIVQRGTKHEALKNKLIAKFPNAKIAKIQKGNYLYEVDLARILDAKKPNWVFLESNDVAMISNVIPLLNAKAESHKVTLFTTEKNKAFDNDNIKNEQLSKMHLHYPSIDKEYDVEEMKLPFVERYKKKYGVAPNKFAVRGFDIAYDILMRLGTADDLYHAATFEGTTEYVENKFNYAKKLLGGYYNKASYIIKFDDDLKLTVVE